MKLQKNLLHGIMCAGLAATLSFAQSTGTQSGVPTSQSGDTTSTTSGQSTTRTGTDTTEQKGRTGTGSSADRMNQSSGSSQTSGAGHSGHVAGAAGSGTTGDQSMVGKQDREFMMKTAMSNIMEIQTAQMAQQKASSQEVKDYARKLEQDHTKATEKLKAIAQERQVDLPSEMGAEHQAHMSKLNNLSGAEFDRQYMKMQVQHHKKDVKEFERASNRSMDSDLKEFASATLPTLREHLQAAQQLNSGSPRSRSADPKSSGSSSSGSSATGSSTDHSSHGTSGQSGQGTTSGSGSTTTPPQP